MFTHLSEGGIIWQFTDKGTSRQLLEFTRGRTFRNFREAHELMTLFLLTVLENLSLELLLICFSGLLVLNSINYLPSQREGQMAAIKLLIEHMAEASPDRSAPFKPSVFSGS